MSDYADDRMRSIMLPIDEIVFELFTQHGSAMVVEVSHETDWPTIQSWAAATSLPSPEQAQRLRNAHATLWLRSWLLTSRLEQGAVPPPGKNSTRDPVWFEAKLSDSDEGEFMVTTLGAIYVIDLDARTVVRFQRSETGHETAALRRDGEPMKLLRLISCSVGWSLVMLLDLDLDPPSPTLRPSTEVISIVRT